MNDAIVIVGAGECGARAAMALREGGHRGPVTLIGDEPQAPYERPPLSKTVLTDEAAPEPTTVVNAERLAELEIDFIAGTRASSIDRDGTAVHLDDGRRLAYDRLLITTGSHPRRLRLEGSDHPAIAYLRTFEDAVRLRSAIGPDRKVVVVGGGFIGLEVAASARNRGADVTVIEALPRLMSRAVPEEIATFVEARHRAEGVDIRCSEGVAGFADRSGQAEVHLAEGGDLPADLVVVGIGVVPEVALAAAAGLEIDNGIATDDRLRTSDPAILAAGDCCSFELPVYGERRVRLESWRAALDLGALAARNLMGADEAIGFVPWFWSDQYDLQLQVAGLVDEGAETVRRQVRADATVLFHLDRAGRLVAASGVGPGGAVARDIRVAQMLIERHAHPPPEQLAAPEVKLKSLLGR